MLKNICVAIVFSLSLFCLVATQYIRYHHDEFEFWALRHIFPYIFTDIAAYKGEVVISLSECHGGKEVITVDPSKNNYILMFFDAKTVKTDCMIGLKTGVEPGK